MNLKKISKNVIVQRMPKNLPLSKFQVYVVSWSRLDQLDTTFTYICQNCTKNPFSSKKQKRFLHL